MKPRIRTYTGREVNPLDLKPEDISIIDIAHHLALMNRFVGGTVMPISVAQHSWFVWWLCRDDNPTVQLQAVLHDATEAYLGDVTKWLKATPEMAAFREAEDRAQRVIFARFNLPFELAPEIEWADRVMVRFEGQMGYGNGFRIDHPNYPPLTNWEILRVGVWRFWTWEQAEARLLKLFSVLGLKDE